MGTNGTPRTGREAVGVEGDSSEPPEPESLRVAIVADVRLFRDGLAELVGRASDVEVIAAVRSGDAWQIDPVELRPDVVLWDVATQNSVDAIRDFATAAPDVGVLVLSVEELEPDVIRLAEAGMAGCVTRDADIGELVDAIRSVAAGEFPCTPRVAGRLLRRVGTLAQRERDESAASLTPRELEIVRLIARGESGPEIAAELHIAHDTVRTHVRNAMKKTGARSRAHLVAKVLGEGYALG